MPRTFAIDFFVDSIPKYQAGYAVIVADVIRATTTAITAVSGGRRCFVAGSLPEAYLTSRRVPNALLVGEIGGKMPAGFQMNNSPAALAARRHDSYRPVVLLSSSGSALMHQAGTCDIGYVACFRNHSATADYVIHSRHPRVALIGAGTGSEIREEDAICCALMAQRLVAAGYEAENDLTRKRLMQWGGACVRDCLTSNSVRFLERSGQLADLDFILQHIDDVETAFIVEGNQICAVSDWERQVLAS